MIEWLKTHGFGGKIFLAVNGYFLLYLYRVRVSTSVFLSALFLQSSNLILSLLGFVFLTY